MLKASKTPAITMNDSLSRKLGRKGIWSRCVIFHKSWSQKEGPVNEKKKKIRSVGKDHEEMSELQTIKASDGEDNDNHDNPFNRPWEVSEKQLA